MLEMFSIYSLNAQQTHSENFSNFIDPIRFTQTNSWQFSLIYFHLWLVNIRSKSPLWLVFSLLPEENTKIMHRWRKNNCMRDLLVKWFRPNLEFLFRVLVNSKSLFYSKYVNFGFSYVGIGGSCIWGILRENWWDTRGERI